MKTQFLTLLFIFLCLSTNLNASQVNDSIPDHETITIKSALLKEIRTINIWKPAGVHRKLPVLYMLDGGLKEDFPHLANTLKKLIDRRAIPPMLLVGIENTQRRRDLTGFTSVKEDREIAPVVGGSIPFRNFIKTELFPEISKKYNTNNQRSIIGESLAGLFIVETLFTEPELFDAYIAFDPSLWWNDHELVRDAKKLILKLPLTQKKFWFAGSNTNGIQAYTNALSETMKKENLKPLKWIYVSADQEQHDTIFKATKERALVWSFGVTP